MRLLIELSPDVTLSSVSCALAIREAARPPGDRIGILANREYEGWFSQTELPVFRAPTPPGLGRMLSTTASIISVGDYAALMGYDDPDFLEESLSSELAAINSFQPDVILSFFRLTSFVSAKRANLPLAAFAAWPLDPRNPDNINDIACVDRRAVDWFEKNGATIRHSIAEAIFDHADLKIVTSIPELQNFPDPQSFTFVGHLTSSSLDAGGTVPNAWRDAGFRVLLYLSVSDLDETSFFDTLEVAISGTDVRALVGLGTPPQDTRPPLSGRYKQIDFCWSWNSNEALSLAHLLVFHGGQNTMMAALLHGVPLIGIPLDSSERRENVALVVRQGAGLMLETEDLNVNGVRMAIEKIRSDTRYRQVAQALGDRARRLGGPSRTVSLMRTLASQAVNHEH